jgi:hypothetical protein
MNLAHQIIQAEECARRIALETPAVRRPRASFSGAGRSTGLRTRILELLPTSEANAILKGEMTALLEDFPHAYSGISSSLANLVKTGEAQHVGEKGAYRYYRSRS